MYQSPSLSLRCTNLDDAPSRAESNEMVGLKKLILLELYLHCRTTAHEENEYFLFDSLHSFSNYNQSN